MTIGKADRWRIISTLLAAVCVVLALTLWSALERLHETEGRVRGSLEVCPTSLEELEHL